MFKRITPPDETVTIIVDGAPVQAAKGESVAAALLTAGKRSFRKSVSQTGHRAPYCMIGTCFECRVEIDGIAHQQACLMPVRDGMQIKTADETAP